MRTSSGSGFRGHCESTFDPREPTPFPTADIYATYSLRGSAAVSAAIPSTNKQNILASFGDLACSTWQGDLAAKIPSASERQTAERMHIELVSRLRPGCSTAAQPPRSPTLWLSPNQNHKPPFSLFAALFPTAVVFHSGPDQRGQRLRAQEGVRVHSQSVRGAYQWWHEGAGATHVCCSAHRGSCCGRYSNWSRNILFSRCQSRDTRFCSSSTPSLFPALF